MKFEVGKEYERVALGHVISRHVVRFVGRSVVVMEHVSGARSPGEDAEAAYPHVALMREEWRPALRTVERWIVETRNGLREIHDAEERADARRERLSRLDHEVIVARVSYEVPW